MSGCAGSDQAPFIQFGSAATPRGMPPGPAAAGRGAAGIDAAIDAAASSAGDPSARPHRNQRPRAQSSSDDKSPPPPRAQPAVTHIGSVSLCESLS